MNPHGWTWEISSVSSHVNNIYPEYFRIIFIIALSLSKADDTSASENYATIGPDNVLTAHWYQASM